MTAFIWVALAMTGVALLWVLPRLLRSRKADAHPQPQASNLEILREQLREIERDVGSGTLSSEQYQSAREDLERRVIEEAKQDSAAADIAKDNGTIGLAIALALLIPACALLLYLQVGTPNAVSRTAAKGDEAHSVTPQEIEAMVGRLAARLEQNPNDGDGWALLGRSYLALQRYKEGAEAYRHAASLIHDDADLLADYADALASSRGRKIDGEVLKILDQALVIDPSQWKALMIAGTAAFDAKDYRKAVAYWEKVRARAEPGSEFARSIESSIAEARELGNIKGELPKGEAPKVASAAAVAPSTKPATAASASVQGTVSLSPALAAKANPADTVFIYARAAQGPRMPLAIVRRQVKDLPFSFTLDDSLAMAPAMKLSNFSDIVVGARISKSANATPQSGDLQGTSPTIKVGATKVAVVIDSAVP